MNNNILLICKGSTFMVDAITSNLKKAGFGIQLCQPVLNDFKEKEDFADIYLFYLGDYLDTIREMLVYMKDVCVEKEKNLSVIGDDEEVRMLQKSIPETLISNVFSRPLDIGKVVSVLVDVAQNQDEYNARKNILLVDDDVTFLHMARGWLEEKYKVIIVNSGMQALTYIAKNTPDLILLDYEMPVTSGPQILKMIRSEPTTAEIPVIFLTGKGDKESVTKVLNLKPEGYVLKTTGQRALMEQIENFFEARKGKSL